MLRNFFPPFFVFFVLFPTALYDVIGGVQMFRGLIVLLILLIAALLVGIVVGMIFVLPLLALLCAFGVILLMWIGFMLKAIQQNKETRK
jgi:hypothetical protein